MRFGILKKFLLAFLVLSLIPLIGLSFHTWFRMNRAGQTVVETTRRSLTANAMSLLETRAKNIASQVELFLAGASDDVRLLATLPATDAVFRNFAAVHRRKIWTREAAGDNPPEKWILLPLYREVTFADASGVERIRIEEGAMVPPGRIVTKRFFSAFGPEDYFRKAKALPPGKIHVSRLAGRHVHRQEQLRGAQHVEDAVGGTEYVGIIRFAQAIYKEGEFRGVVSLGLDHRHLMEYTQHILPSKEKAVLFPRYRSGNYAFMFDDLGWILTHPRLWDIRGYDRATGSLADPAGPSYNVASLRSGTVPFNLLYVPFIHTNYRHIALSVLAKKSGVTRTASVGGVQRVLAFAPIHFSDGDYAETGCFGGVTLGAQADFFHQAIDENAGRIDTALRKVVNNFILIIAFAGIAVGCIAVFLAKSFTRPILQLTENARQIGRGNFDSNIAIDSGDELEILGNSFKEMGEQLRKNETRLVRSLSDLKTSRDAVRSYNTRLQNHVEILKNIHSGSHLLTRSFNRNSVYEVILETCVQGIGFERAILYVPNEIQGKLECARSWGFSPAHEEIVRNTAFKLDNEINLQTRLFASGLPLLVTDVESDNRLSDQDLCLAQRIGSKSIALAPVQIAGRTIGVLAADHTASLYPISSEMMESLKIVANEAAMAIERASLVTEAFRRRDLIENIFSNIMSGLLVFDSKGIILSANPKMKELFGRAPEQLIGLPVNEMLAPYPDLLALLEEGATVGESAAIPVELVRPGGRNIFLETAISPLSPEPGTGERSTLLIFRDATMRINMERHLSRSDRLVSLGILAAGVAHEIRNPLTGISLLLDDLHDRMANRMDERLMMQRALEEIEKLEGIVTDLLEFAVNPETRPVREEINRVIDDSLFFVKKQCRKQGVDLILNKGKSLPHVIIDPERVKQAILNIVLNALNVLEAEGGQIRITSKVVEKPFVMPGHSCVEVAILDNGPGISREDIDFIFDPFFSHNPKGSGLGLSITHSIIEEQGGKIVVVSEPGSGACFKIYLPVAEGTDV